MATELAPTAEKASALWEDFIDVFYAPTRVFERRRLAGFGLALLVLSVLAAIAFFAVRPFYQPFFDHQFSLGLEQIRNQPGMTAEQLEQMRPMMERTASIVPLAAGLVGTPVFVLLLAVAVWLSSLVTGARLSFGQAALVSTYANVPRVLGTLAGAAVLALKDPTTLPLGLQAFTSPAVLLGPDASPVLTALLGRLDLFTIWTTVLIGIGVAVVGRVAKGKGWATAGVVFGVATLFALVNGLRAAAQMAG